MLRGLLRLVLKRPGSIPNSGDITYYFVNYPVDQSDTHNPGTDTISGTLVTDGALGVQTDGSNFVGGSITIATPVGSYSSTLTAVNYNHLLPVCTLTPTQILLPGGDFMSPSFAASPGFSSATIGYSNTPPIMTYGAVLYAAAAGAPGPAVAGWSSLQSGAAGSISASQPWVVASTTAALPSSPLGGATLVSDSSGLTAGNLGASGADGISLDLSAVPSASAATAAVDLALAPLGDHSIGSYISVAASGYTATMPDMKMLGGQVTQVAAGSMRLTNFVVPCCGYHPVVNYYSGGPGGTLVYSEPLPASPSIAFANWPTDVHFATDNTVDPEYSFGLGWGTSAGAMTTAGGLVLPADDEIDYMVVSADYPKPLQFSSAALTAGGGDISSVTLTGETVAVTPEPSTLALLAAGALGLLGCGWRRRRLAKRTAAPIDDAPATLSFPSLSAPQARRRAA